MKKIILFFMVIAFVFSGCISTNISRVEDSQPSDPQSSTFIKSQMQDEMFERYLRMTEETGKTWNTYTDFSGTIADTDTFLMLDVSVTPPSAGTVLELPFLQLKNNLENFDVLGLPYGTQPTVDANAEIAADTTDDQLVVYIDAVRVFTYKHRQCFTLEDPADADDNVPIFSHEDGFTVTDMRCWTEGGTSAVVTLEDDSADSLDSMTCDSNGADDDGIIENATFTADEQMSFDVGTVIGAVDWVNYCFTYTITRE